MRHFAEGWPGVVALDGKTLRRSFDRAAGASPLHLVSAWATEQRLVLGQVAVGDKSNEITAVPQLLKMLSLSGVGVTADAMACQREIARTITDQGGAYVLALKGNQGTLLEDVKLVLGDPALALATAQTTDGEHGRIEVRRAALTSEIAIVRAHWGIENGLHWVLDGTMNEDGLRNRKDHGPENLALLRRLALNLATLEPSKASVKAKQKRAGWDNAYLAAILAQAAKSQVR